MRTCALLMLAACEASPTLADLGPLELELHLRGGQPSVEVWIGYDLPICATLGDDFAASVDGEPLHTFAGGYVATCHRPTTSQPCESKSECALPWIGGGMPPAVDHPILELGDGSRTISCDLGDALLPRSIERVPAVGWSVTRGEHVTVRWTPAEDLQRLPFDVELRKPKAIVGTTLPSEIDGDRVSFHIPEVAAGPYFLRFHIGGTHESRKGCGDVLNRRRQHYYVDADIVVQ